MRRSRDGALRLDSIRGLDPERRQYLLLNLVPHLVDAGRFEQVHDLLTQDDGTSANAWYRAKDESGEYASYEEDVRLASTLAKRTHGSLALRFEVAYALMAARVREKARELGPAIISAHVRAGRWPVAKALAMARSMEPKQRLLVVSELLPLLTPMRKPAVLAQAAQTFIQLRNDRSMISAWDISPEILAEPTVEIDERAPEKWLTRIPNLAAKGICALKAAGLDGFERYLATIDEVWVPTVCIKALGAADPEARQAIARLGLGAARAIYSSPRASSRVKSRLAERFPSLRILNQLTAEMADVKSEGTPTDAMRAYCQAHAIGELLPDVSDRALVEASWEDAFAALGDLISTFDRPMLAVVAAVSMIGGRRETSDESRLLADAILPVAQQLERPGREHEHRATAIRLFGDELPDPTYLVARLMRAADERQQSEAWDWIAETVRYDVDHFVKAPRPPAKQLELLARIEAAVPDRWRAEVWRAIDEQLAALTPSSPNAIGLMCEIAPTLEWPLARKLFQEAVARVRSVHWEQREGVESVLRGVTQHLSEAQLAELLKELPEQATDDWFLRSVAPRAIDGAGVVAALNDLSQRRIGRIVSSENRDHQCLYANVNLAAEVGGPAIEAAVACLEAVAPQIALATLFADLPVELAPKLSEAQAMRLVRLCDQHLARARDWSQRSAIARAYVALSRAAPEIERERLVREALALMRGAPAFSCQNMIEQAFDAITPASCPAALELVETMWETRYAPHFGSYIDWSCRIAAIAAEGGDRRPLQRAVRFAAKWKGAFAAIVLIRANRHLTARQRAKLVRRLARRPVKERRIGPVIRIWYRARRRTLERLPRELFRVQRFGHGTHVSWIEEAAETLCRDGFLEEALRIVSRAFPSGCEAWASAMTRLMPWLPEQTKDETRSAVKHLRELWARNETIPTRPSSWGTMPLRDGQRAERDVDRLRILSVCAETGRGESLRHETIAILRDWFREGTEPSLRRALLKRARSVFETVTPEEWSALLPLFTAGTLDESCSNLRELLPAIIQSESEDVRELREPIAEAAFHALRWWR